MASGRIRRVNKSADGGARRLNNKPNSTTAKSSSGPNSRRTDACGVRIENMILSQIPETEYDLIRPHLELLETGSYQTLLEPGEKLDYAYFPNAGMISIVAELSDGRTLEVGLVTKKGFAGQFLTSGRRICPYRMICQPAIEGFQIKIETLDTILPSAPDLRFRLKRYMHFQALRVSQIAACNRFHETEQRLARWLLASLDRVGSMLLPFTHEFLATILGTGRASVSIAAGTLQDAGLIRYRRGDVKVLNRKKLEDAACECYGTIKQFEADSERERV
jgi:CRP-like cAMP-binding protein